MRIPEQNHYSTRCPISHRPPFHRAEPLFYRCAICGNVMVLHPEKSTGETPILKCCGTELQNLKPHRIHEGHEMEFVVFGGFEQNAIRISVDGGLRPENQEHQIEWIYLYTYQGGQIKFLQPGAKPVAQFALADEDAYVYCDRPVCRMGREHCQFECKRGMAAYAYCTEHGLLYLPLTGLNRESQ